MELQRTLVLTPWMSPHRIVGWEDAMTMLFTGKIRVVEEYDDVVATLSLDQVGDYDRLFDHLPARALEGDAITLRVPAVATLTKPVRTVKRAVQFSRMNVFVRDGFKCQYCGGKFHIRDLNYDHVVPSTRGGRTVWENIVASCYPCNGLKGNAVPDKDGRFRVVRDGRTRDMRLLRRPFKPESLPIVPLHIDMDSIPEIWRAYCTIPGSEEPDAQAAEDCA